MPSQFISSRQMSSLWAQISVLRSGNGVTPSCLQSHEMVDFGGSAGKWWNSHVKWILKPNIMHHEMEITLKESISAKVKSTASYHFLRVLTMASPSGSNSSQPWRPRPRERTSLYPPCVYYIVSYRLFYFLITIATLIIAFCSNLHLVDQTRYLWPKTQTL